MSSAKSLRLPALTGIRGVAALWVVLFHVQTVASYLRLPALVDLPIVKDGFRGVDLFFILSGFILVHVHREFAALSRAAIGRFAVQRAIRIYPPALAVLLLIALAIPWLPDFVGWYRHSVPDRANSYSLAGFFQTALLANRWLMPDMGEWNGPVWSLSLEVLAYGLFPWLAWVVRRLSRWWALALAVGLLLALVAFEVLSGLQDINLTGRLAMVRTMACFPAGVLLHRAGTVGDGASGRGPWRVVASASALMLGGVLVVPGLAVLSPLCFAGMIAGVSFGGGAVDAFLSRPGPMFLGKISFSLYLVHFVPLWVLAWAVSTGRLPSGGWLSAAYVLAALTASIAGAAALHHGVELPAQRAGRRLASSMPKIQDAPT